MPTGDEHLAKELSNSAAEMELVSGGRFADWAVTLAFYRAVHLGEAYYARRNVHHRTHESRNQAISRDLPPAVSARYLRLADLSRRARYDPAPVIQWPQYTEADQLRAAVFAHIQPLI